MQAVSIKNSLVILFLMCSTMTVGQMINTQTFDTTTIKPRLKLNLKKDLNRTYSFDFTTRNNQKSYSEQLPFFCKMEHKLSLNSKIPVRIRLGSLDYVNKLEGKGN